MSVIFIEKEYLDVALEDEIGGFDCSFFFSSFKYSHLYVVNERQELVGYIDRSSFLNGNDRSVKKCPYILGENVVSSETLFEWHPDLYAVPAVDFNNRLIGAYIRSLPDELISLERVMNKIALSVLPAFLDEFVSFVHSKGVSSLQVIAEREDFNCLQERLRGLLPIILFEESEDEKFSEPVLVVDMKYSKSIRDLRLGDKEINVFTLEELVALSILPLVVGFFHECEVPLFLVEGPMKEKLSHSEERWPQLYRKIGLRESIEDENLISCFFQGNRELIEWAKDQELGIMGGDCVCTNGVHLLMSDRLAAKSQTKEAALPRIFVYGSCLAYGVCVPSYDRISACLQKLVAGEYEVVNLAVKNGRSLLNDLLYMLNTDIKRGDVVIDLNHYRSGIGREIESMCPIYESSAFMNEHPDPSFNFLDNTFHANAAVCRSIAAYLHEVIGARKHSNLGDTGSEVVYLRATHRLERIDSASILGQSLMQSYIEYVRRHKRPVPDQASVGSVILTANPLTLGHEYLVRFAKQRCSLLYVFIVEEDRFQYSTLERLSFALNVFDDPDIVVLSTGNVMTAYYTFPDYFSTSHSRSVDDKVWIPDYHCYLFGAVVAPILGINKRFIGEEIPGSVTNHYNEKIKEILPSYGIDVEVIPRLHDKGGLPLSASRARQYAEGEEWGKLSEMVSPKVMNFMLNYPHRSAGLIHSGHWSSAYREGEVFIKKYRYLNLSAIEREAKASSAALKYGLRAPSFQGTFKRDSSVYNSFDYIWMRPVEEVFLLQSNNYRGQCELLLTALPRVPWDLGDRYWEDSLLPEYENALSFLDYDVRHYLSFLSQLVPSVFIHGDLTCQNLGLTKEEELVVYDFQHGSLGPVGWDKSYLASTFPADKFFLPMSFEERLMAEAISAIRWGRSIRKRAVDINKREKLFQSWIKRNR